MKKILILALVVATLFTSGCGNRQMIDFTYTYDRAIVKLPDGTVVDGRVNSWRDYEGEQLQVVIDGVTYLVHSENIALINN